MDDGRGQEGRLRRGARAVHRRHLRSLVLDLEATAVRPAIYRCPTGGRLSSTAARSSSATTATGARAGYLTWRRPDRHGRAGQLCLAFGHRDQERAGRLLAGPHRRRLAPINPAVRSKTRRITRELDPEDDPDGLVAAADELLRRDDLVAAVVEIRELFDKVSDKFGDGFYLPPGWYRELDLIETLQAQILPATGDRDAFVRRADG